MIFRMTPTLRRTLDTLHTTPGARLTRWVMGRKWRDVLVVDGVATRLPAGTIDRLEMALAVREAGGSCRWTRFWVAF